MANKPGTPDKGPRKPITVRVPEHLWDAIDSARHDAGYGNVCDYLTAVLAEHHGVPVPAYARPMEQEESILQAS